MLRTNLSQEYDCPRGSDSDINEPNLVHHGQKFYCHWCGGEHTAGVDVQVSTIRDWRDYPALPQSAEELQALINEDETPKITNQELHALRKKVATYEARDALGLLPAATTPYAPLTTAEARDLTCMHAGAPWPDEMLPELQRLLGIYDGLRAHGQRPVDPATLPRKVAKVVMKTGLLPATSAAPAEDEPDEVIELRALAATCYAGLGAECNLPENWLDALHAAANGEPFTTAGLLPFKAEPSPQAESQPAPIDMVLHCPACGLQHIDAPESAVKTALDPNGVLGWTNPPHRSHLCHGCGHIWRPADVPTNGVAAVKTTGKADSVQEDAALDAGAVDRIVSEHIGKISSLGEGNPVAKLNYYRDLVRAGFDAARKQGGA